jgi:hypothetical protein
LKGEKDMAADAPGGDVSSWTQWVVGGLAAGGSLVTGWLYAAIQKARKEDAHGRAALWDRVNRQSDAAANDRLEAERRYATQADVDKLREHIDRKFDDQLIRFTDLLLNRPPVKHP